MFTPDEYAQEDLVVGDRTFPWFALAEGYRQSMTDAGLEPRYSEIRSEDRESDYLAVQSLLARNIDPTTLFAGNERAACGV